MRSKAETYRIYGSPERQAFVRAMGCHICGAEPELAHTKSGGTGRKANADTIVPLCHAHHAELHQEGGKSFGAAYGFDLHELAAWVESEWQERVTSTQLTD